MDSKVLEYLKTQSVCVLAVEMPDGSPHAATVNFTHVEDPLTLVVMTGPTSRKHEALSKGVIRASMVVGVNDNDMRTLQMNGHASFSQHDDLQKLYYDKFPEAVHMFKKDVLITFTPTWWRFTDWVNKVTLCSH